MQMPKELREKPFERYSGLKNYRIRYQVNAFPKMYNHEKQYIVELIANQDYCEYRWGTPRHDKSIRIVISKKQKDYAVFLEGSQKSSRPDMSKYISRYEYCDISEQSKKVLGNLLGVKKEHISHLYDLFNLYHVAKCEERRQKNGYINDDVVYECPTEFPKDGAIWVMPKKTFYKKIVGMVDENGQPIARTNIGLGGKPEPRIFGRKVEFADKYMSAFSASVTADTIVAAIYDFADYGINMNYQITIKKYTDEATDDQIMKATTLVDGKSIRNDSLVTLVVKNS